jgi:hypothetical protein
MAGDAGQLKERNAVMTENTSTRYEEFKVKGDDLIAKVREIVHDGNVSRLFIKHDNGETILEVPLTAGVAVAAAGVILAPVLVAVSAVAALVTRVTIGVERRETGDSTVSEEAPPTYESASSTEAAPSTETLPFPEAAQAQGS